METLYTGRLHGFPNLTAAQFGPIPEEGVLSLVVVLATSVSLVALVFAFITYSLFSDLRNLMGTTVMTLLATTFMGQLIYVVGVGGVHDRELCLSISFSLHYLHLAAILWLASLCVEAQRAKRESSLPQGMCIRFMLSCIICWGVPALSVSAAYAASDTQHLGHMYKVNCWFTEAKIYLLTYSFPALCLLIGCACALIRSRVSLEYRMRLEPDLKSRTRMSSSGCMELSLYARMVGLLTSLELCSALYLATGHYVFWAGYNVLHSVQGVLMALAATCNSQVLSVYTRRTRRRRSGTRLLSKTSSLETLDWSPLPNTV